jgi:hypothetical protein
MKVLRNTLLNLIHVLVVMRVVRPSSLIVVMVMTRMTSQVAPSAAPTEAPSTGRPAMHPTLTTVTLATLTALIRAPSLTAIDSSLLFGTQGSRVVTPSEHLFTGIRRSRGVEETSSLEKGPAGNG